MSTMRKIFVIAASLIFLFLADSCKKENDASNGNGLFLFDKKQFYDCSASQNIDSTILSNQLIGSWKWTYFLNEKGSDGKAINGKANKDVKVTFTNTGTFSISENSTVITQGNWNVFFENNNGYKLNLSVPSSYLFGSILLGENQVMFNDSYVDGSDYVYTKN